MYLDSVTVKVNAHVDVPNNVYLCNVANVFMSFHYTFFASQIILYN